MVEPDRYIWDVKSEYKKPKGVSLHNQYYKKYDSWRKWTYIDGYGGRLNMDGFISVNDYLFREYSCKIGDIVLISGVKYILLNISPHSHTYVTVMNFITGVKYLKNMKDMKSLVKERNEIINDILDGI